MEDDGKPEVLDLGVVDEPARDGSGEHRPASPGRRGLLLTLAGAAAVVGGGAAIARSGNTAPPPSPPSPSPTPAPTPVPTVTTSATGTATTGPDVTVTQVGPLLPGANADLFALADRMLIRAVLGTGEVTTTRLPPLGDSVSMVPVRGAVLIHLESAGATYVVRDDWPVDDAPAGLASLGRMLPGPDPDHVWVTRGDGSASALTLVGIDGRRTGTTVPLPASADGDPQPDGTGYPLVRGIGGVYRGRPGGVTRLTTGVILAAGGAGWLAVECDEAARCSYLLLGTSGARRPLAGVVDPGLLGSVGFTGPGALSPDARTAVLYRFDASTQTLRPVLVDLADGRRTSPDLTLAQSTSTPALAWTPDSRHVLTADSRGRAVTLDPGTGRSRPLFPRTGLPELPPITSIVLRPASAA